MPSLGQWPRRSRVATSTARTQNIFHKMIATFGSDLLPPPPTTFATVSDDGLISLYDASSGELQQQYTRPTQLAVRWTCVAQLPNTVLALGTDSGLVVIWDLAVGRVSHELRGHTQRVLDVAFEAGGSTLLSCSRDRQVCCWRVASGELLHTFDAGQAAVHRLAPTASGSHVLLGSTALRLVRRDAWKRAGRAPGHASRISCLCLSPDDKLAASAAADDRHVSIWRVTPAALSAEGGEPCVQTLALETRIIQLAFHRPAAASSDGNGGNGGGQSPPRYTLLVLTASGLLGLWSFASSAANPPSGKKKAKQIKAGGAVLPPLLAAKPPCVVRVAPLENGSETTTTSAATDGDDPQRIFHAAFIGPTTLLVAYGSQVRPSFTTVHLAASDGGGGLIESIELPRVSDGILGAAPVIGGGPRADSSKGDKKGKRPREQQLGALDYALPSQKSGRSAGAAMEEEEAEAAATAKAAEAAAAAPAAAAEKDAEAAMEGAGEEGIDEFGGGEEEEEEEPPAEEIIAEEVGGMPTFGQRLAAMEHERSMASSSSAAALPGGAGVALRKPSAASQVTLLVQALQNGDAGMLDEALLIQDAQTIASTVARLPMTSVLPFLEAVLQRVQGRPARVASLASWMRALLAQHAAYLMGCPQLLPMLTPLYQLIEERLTAFKPLLKLVGRMQMLQSQIAAHQEPSDGGLLTQEPMLVWDEAEEEEKARLAAEEGEEEGEEEEDEESGEEDDDDEEESGEEEDDDDEFGFGGGDDDDDGEEEDSDDGPFG